MVNYPVKFRLPDGTQVEVTPVQNKLESGQRLIFDLILPDGTADSFVWSSVADPKDPADPSESIPRRHMDALHWFWQIERNS